MFGSQKRKIQNWSVIFSSLMLCVACTGSVTKKVVVAAISGETQGTTYTIQLVNPETTIKKSEIDSLLHQFDMSLSTYIENSLISKMNATPDSITVIDTFGYVNHCYRLSTEIYLRTSGAFDPSVYPLVKGYGFMTDMETPLDQQKIDSILKFVSFEQGKHHRFSNKGNTLTFVKHHPDFMMDFNAIAQGYSVDVVAEYLDKRGIKNYFVEIGGEIRVMGVNKDGVSWRIGVDVPEESIGKREIENILAISDGSVATSGDYRKFYVKDGVKYAHTLNPETGKPVQHSLLSATVVAGDCATADAYATAFMVMGTNKALRFIEANPSLKLHAYLLEADSTGTIQRHMSDGFEQFIAK